MIEKRLTFKSTKYLLSLENRMFKKMLVILLTMSFLSFLSACNMITNNPYTGEHQISKTIGGATVGAGIGALGGALVGSSKNAGRNALIGAGIGAIAGGMTGSYIDQQEADLRARLEGSNVSISRKGNNIMINMPGSITFNTNQDAIKAQFYSQLDAVAQVLKKYDKSRINVQGHTDSIGNSFYNLSLSKRRAQSVAQYLNSRGIDMGRLNVAGYGSSNPISNNTTEWGRELNRRVELIIVPISI